MSTVAVATPAPRRTQLRASPANGRTVAIAAAPQALKPAGAEKAAAAEPDVEVASLRTALADSEAQLASARDAIFALSTGRRVLVQEVLELRALLAGQGSQRQYDSLATRDAALEKLESREAQVRELQVTVKELQSQLHRQQLALQVGHELSREVCRAARRSRPAPISTSPYSAHPSHAHPPTGCHLLASTHTRRRRTSPRSRARLSSWRSSRRARCATRCVLFKRRRVRRRRSDARSTARWLSSSGARSGAPRRGGRPRSTPPLPSSTRPWVVALALALVVPRREAVSRVAVREVRHGRFRRARARTRAARRAPRRWSGGA